MRLRLAAATNRLAEELDGIYHRQTISALVAESAASLSRRGITPFVHILAERFARERLRAQAQSEGRLAKESPQVLFVSVGGGGRALMGAALLQRRVGDAVTVQSAASGETAEIPKNVRARSVGEVQIPHNVRHLDLRAGNPGDADLDEVRRVREDIERRVEDLAEELVHQAASTTA